MFEFTIVTMSGFRLLYFLSLLLSYSILCLALLPELLDLAFIKPNIFNQQMIQSLNGL